MMIVVASRCNAKIFRQYRLWISPTLQKPS